MGLYLRRWGSQLSCPGDNWILLSGERHVMYTAAIARPESDGEIDPYDRTAWHTPESRTQVGAADGSTHTRAAIGYTGVGRFLYLGESSWRWGESGSWFSVGRVARADPAPGVAIHGGRHLLAHIDSWGSASLVLGLSGPICRVGRASLGRTNHPGAGFGPYQ